MALTPQDAETFERCMSVGGFAVFPTDTVYGLACDPEAKETLERIYLLKRRPPTKPSATMFFQLELALAALPELPPATRAAFSALLPGGVTLLVSNADGATLGIRVPQLPEAAAALHAVRWPILQTSANLSGEADPRRLEDVPERLRQAADLVLDAGELPGTPSTVVDLRDFEQGQHEILREGAVPSEVVAARLAESRA